MLAEEDRPSVTFISPEGIQFISYSELWSRERLEELYQPLLLCEHGEELAVLERVILYPEKSRGLYGPRIGNYNERERTIRLFEVDALPVERTFIHEYGHHFTYYWLKKQEGIYPPELKETNVWSKLRGLGGYPIRWAGSPLPDVHKWDPGEIMAEDYVLLFGTGALKPPDRPEELINYLRHENEYIPPVGLLPAVREYWEKAAGLTHKTPLREPEVKELRIVEQENGAVLQVEFQAVREEAKTDPVRYAVHSVAFGGDETMPVSIKGALCAENGETARCELEWPEGIGRKDTAYMHLAIWAYDETERLLVQSPLYANWYEADNLSGRLSDIPPPGRSRAFFMYFEKKGWCAGRWFICLSTANSEGLRNSGRKRMERCGFP
ncbi:hypothetical protein LJK87_16915 [Paenibacillus sp. P25]|nr:hypothetical protein LJK87_16915 [Paenibacillus sp. P25]